MLGAKDFSEHGEILVDIQNVGKIFWICSPHICIFSYWLPSVTLLTQNCVICVDFALCARSLRDAKLCYKNANAGIVTDSVSRPS